VPGTDFMELHFGRKVLRIFISMKRIKLDPKFFYLITLM
jgi:hypothetical protein